MKWKILSNGFMPLFKCGAASASADVVGTWLNNFQQEENVSRQLRAQQQENQKNRDWQTQQAELDRQFQSQQQQLSFGQQQQLQSKQQEFNLQSMAQQAYYNSPVYMSQELRRANINPQVYFGNHASFGGSSAQSGGAPSAPAPAHGSMPGSVSGLSPVSYQPKALDVAAIGSAMKSFAEAKKLGIESDWLPKALQADIMNKKSYSDLNQVLSLGQKINNEIQNAKVPYSIRMAAADLERTLSEIDLNKQKTLTDESQAKVNASLERLNSSLEKLNQKEFEKFGIFLKYYENQLQAQLDNLRSDTELKSEQANETYWSGEIKAVDAFIRKATKMDDVLARLHEFQAKDIKSQADRYAACEELAKNIMRAKAYENENYAKINACIEMLAEKFAIPVAIVAKYFLK